MADEIQAISKVEGIGKKSLDHAKKVTREDLDPSMANKDHFEHLMAQERKKENLQVQQQEDSKRNSLLDEVSNLNSKVNDWKTNPDNLVAQAQDALTKIDEIKGKLATPNLEIKPPVQNLLKRKLSHIDENLKVALDKAGVDFKDIKPTDIEGISNPIERFLGLLSHSQSKLDKLSTEISGLQKDNINPGDLLTLQVKVNYVQQELEFFTNLLNKSLESTKTLMNVQV